MEKMRTGQWVGVLLVCSLGWGCSSGATGDGKQTEEVAADLATDMGAQDVPIDTLLDLREVSSDQSPVDLAGDLKQEVGSDQRDLATDQSADQSDSLDDADNVLATCQPSPCNQNQECSLVDGAAVCTCKPAFSGPDCQLCAEGFGPPPLCPACTCFDVSPCCDGCQPRRQGECCDSVCGSCLDGTCVVEALEETVLSDDFSEGAGAEWVKVPPVATSPTGEAYIGLMDNQTILLGLHNLPQHTQVRLEFTLYIMATWDGNGTPGPDYFEIIRPDGSTVYRTTFSNQGGEQSYPGEYYASNPGGSGATRTNQIGEFETDYQISLVTDHVGPDLEMWFQGSNLEGQGNEMWGLDNLVVTVLKTCAVDCTNYLCADVLCGEHSQCNPGTGACDCLPGYQGESCGLCAEGFGGFPDCVPCECQAGACCDGCYLKASGSICRPAIAECDVAEYCDGLSADCVAPDAAVPGKCMWNGMCFDEGAPIFSDGCAICITGEDPFTGKYTDGMPCSGNHWSNPCYDETCFHGGCLGVPNDTNVCDDGLDCTKNRCVAGNCIKEEVTDGCLILQQCVGEGATLGSQGIENCFACDPSASTSWWSELSHGELCDDGDEATSHSRCVAGQCAPFSCLCDTVDSCCDGCLPIHSGTCCGSEPGFVCMSGVCAQPSPDYVTVYDVIYESGSYPELNFPDSHIITSQDGPIMGPFGTLRLRLALENLPAHSKIRVSAQVHILWTWDGNQSPGPDYFDVSIVGEPAAFVTTFSNEGSDQSYPDPYPASHTAQSSAYRIDPEGAVYRIVVEMEHNFDFCVVQLSAWNLQGVPDEGWGVKSIKVEAVQTVPQECALQP